MYYVLRVGNVGHLAGRFNHPVTIHQAFEELIRDPLAFYLSQMQDNAVAADREIKKKLIFGLLSGHIGIVVEV
jgi:hypothetical protein